MPRIVEELATGVTVTQVTEDAAETSNIYCELPYCSRDSRYFVYQRTNHGTEPNPCEYVRCEFGTWEQEVIARGLGGPGMTHAGIFYLRRVTDSGQDLLRIDLETLEERVVARLPSDFQPRGLGTISPDESTYAYGVTISYAPQEFGTEILDLASGQRQIIHTDPFTCNPHTQFEPGHGRWVMIQHNRGCEFTPQGERLRLVGDEGATEFLLSIPDGQVTRLPVGPPYTPPITGHEAWISGRDEILMSVGAEGDYAVEQGNLIAVSAAGVVRRLGIPGVRVNHVGTSPCGRLFFVDDWQGESRLLVGSTQTGEAVDICLARTSRQKAQYTHGHPYLSPDLRWLVFNSDRTGDPQIHVACVPEPLIAPLLN